MNFKRKKPLSPHSCRMCKNWKYSLKQGKIGSDAYRHSARLRMRAAEEQVRDVRFQAQ